MTAAPIPIGTRVRVEDLGLPCHYRTPVYARGRCGTVIAYCGAYPNPEALAYGDREAPAIELYRVRIAQTDLWPDYAGSAQDCLEIEIYRHWLRIVESADAP